MNPPDIAKLLARKDELGTLLGRFEFWLLLFGILVVVGVAGESYFGIRSWWNNRKLHEIARQIDQYRQAETAEMNRQAGEAFKQAGEANERAGKLEKEASELTAKNLELEAAIAPRRLSGRQEKTLASLNSPIARSASNRIPVIRRA